MLPEHCKFALIPMCFLRGRLYWVKLAPLGKRVRWFLQPALKAERGSALCYNLLRSHEPHSDPPITSEECKSAVGTPLHFLGLKACCFVVEDVKWLHLSKFPGTVSWGAREKDGCIRNKSISGCWQVWAGEEFWGVGYRAWKGVQRKAWASAWPWTPSLTFNPQQPRSSQTRISGALASSFLSVVSFLFLP